VTAVATVAGPLQSGDDTPVEEWSQNRRNRAQTTSPDMPQMLASWQMYLGMHTCKVMQMRAVLRKRETCRTPVPRLSPRLASTLYKKPKPGSVCPSELE